MTARYQYRLRGGADEPISSRTRNNPALGLPPEVPTVPWLLRKQGYPTAPIGGKWHLGFPPWFGPLKSGYEEFFGAMSGAWTTSPTAPAPATSIYGMGRRSGTRRATSPTCCRAAPSIT